MAEGMLGGPHVVNFQYDDELGCDVDVLCHGIRFHIMVKLSRIRGRSQRACKLVEEYRDLIEAVRRDEEELNTDQIAEKKDLEEAQKHEPDAGVVRRAEIEGPEGSNDQNEADIGADDDSGYETRPASASEKDDSDTFDSQIKDFAAENAGRHLHDLRQQDEDTADEREDEDEDSQSSLQKWVLAPFQSTFSELAPASSAPKQPTLHDYYHTKVFFFTLEIEDGKLTPIEMGESSELHKSIKHLVPSIDVPKYIQNMQVPWISSHDAQVLCESDVPAPIHPAKVLVGNEARFFKLVDASQQSTVKRELKILAKIERLGLHEEMRVPRVLGLVGNGKSKTNIMGFLLTDIGDATPLTEKLDPNVPSDLRDKWSHESGRMVDLLHKNGLVWGDAKADNFLVDASDDLWMIDFGGSYTDGWVEPELCETVEGDDQGLDKIVSALEDPVANTFEPGRTASTADANTESHEGRGSGFVSAENGSSDGKKRKLDRFWEVEDSAISKRKK